MKNTMSGVVISTSMTGVAVVRVERTIRHPIYKKVIIRHKRVKAKIGIDGVKLGDEVSLHGCRPQSKEVHYEIFAKNSV